MHSINVAKSTGPWTIRPKQPLQILWACAWGAGWQRMRNWYQHELVTGIDDSQNLLKVGWTIQCKVFVGADFRWGYFWLDGLRFADRWMSVLFMQSTRKPVRLAQARAEFSRRILGYVMVSKPTFPSLVAQSVKNLPAIQETSFPPRVGKIPWRRKWQPTQVFLPGKSHGQGSLAGNSSWGCRSQAWLSD